MDGKLKAAAIVILGVLLACLCVPAQILNVIIGTAGSGSGPASFTYYVSQSTGSDSNPGTQAQPFQTLSKVNGLSLTAGQSVGLMKGDTWREQLLPPSSGSSGNTIRFGPYGTGAMPVINGSVVASGWAPDSGQASTGNLASINFDSGNFTGWTASTTPPTVISSQFYTSPDSLQVVGGTSANVQNIHKSMTSSLTLYARMYVRMAATGGTSALGLIDLKSGSTTLISFLINPAGLLEYFRSGLGTVTLAASITDTNWHYIEFFWNGGTTTTNGAVTFKLDGTQTYSQAALNLGQTAADTILLGNSSGNTATGMTANLDNADLSNVTWLGPIIFPAANVWQSSVTTSPTAIWISGVSPGIAQASLSALTSQNQWFWGSGVLYLYSTTTPSSTAIEAGAIDYPVEVSTHNFITISGLEVKNANRSTIFLRNCTNVTVDSMLAHDSVSQTILVGIGGGGHTISNSETYNSGLGMVFGQGSNLHFQSTTISSNVTNNYFHGFANPGGDHNVYDESGANVYTSNHFKSAAGTGNCNVRLDSPGSSFFYNIFDTDVPTASACGLDIDAVSNVTAIGNTFYEVGSVSPFGAIFVEAGAGGAQTAIKVDNNLIYSTASFFTGMAVDNSVGWSSANNLVFGDAFGEWNGGSALSLSAWQSTTGQDANSLNSNPQLVNPGAGNYNLQPGSPAINAGVCIPGVTTCPTNIGAK